MRKGVDALQMVFAMFILIVVTLVMIKLFTGIVKPDTLPKIDDFQHAYNYNREKIRCGNLCNSFTSGGCVEMRAATSYCEEKVYIDINGDGRTGERKAYGIIAGEPFCEDGMYCFQIYQCQCGFTELDDKECLNIMRDYYFERTESEPTAKEAVCTKVQPGECEKNPNLWKKKLPGFVPQTIRDGKYAGQIWGADFWWKIAGYQELCAGTSGATTTTASGALQFSCSGANNAITCSWSGCSADVNLIVNPGSRTCVITTNQPSGSCSVDQLASGTYKGQLLCGNSLYESAPVTIP